MGREKKVGRMESQLGRAQKQSPSTGEPRWPALVALLANGGLYAALPTRLAILPPWQLLVIIAALLIPAVLANRQGQLRLNQTLGYVVNSVITVALVGSLILLVRALPAHKETPLELLRSAAALWITNILVFALWYWRLDAGGPNHRDQRPGHTEGAFLFPQMTSDEVKTAAGTPAWSPNFVDYLFLAFNTSTALSPTDVPVLSRWAKLLMMVQSLISLTVLVLLAARAVNIL
jgi:hypothetical protein